MAKAPVVSPRFQLSADEARAIVIRAQGLDGAPIGGGAGGVLRALGAVQLDTISVLARSHELVPYSRIGPVGRKHVEASFWGEPAGAFEYIAHANCILPLDSWPLFAFRRRGMLGRQWRQVEESVINEVRARLKDRPVTASDLGGARQGAGGWWSWSAAKIAAEALYERGELICVTRRGWKRVYDLPERVLPPALLNSDPDDATCFRELVAQSARALGVATRRDIAHYFRLAWWTAGNAAYGWRLIDEAIEANGLVPVAVEGWADIAYVARGVLEAPAPVGQSVTTLLSPFDSLIWADPHFGAKKNSGPQRDRERTERLFGFGFSLEAYLPKARRVRGYFTMPLFTGGRIAGHVDPAREGTTLVARQLSLDGPSALEPMADALRKAASWVGCDGIRLERVDPPELAAAIRSALDSPSPVATGEGESLPGG